MVMHKKLLPVNDPFYDFVWTKGCLISQELEVSHEPAR